MSSVVPLIDINKKWIYIDQKNSYSFSVPIEKMESEYGAILFSVKHSVLEPTNFKLYPKMAKSGCIPSHYFSKNSKVNVISFKILKGGEYLVAELNDRGSRRIVTLATQEALSQTKTSV